MVTAIVLNYRDGIQTVRCVQSLLKQTIADPSDPARASKLEILIIDNHSSDDSIGSIRNRLCRGVACNAPTPVRVLETRENIGFGKGYKTGIAQAQGKYILINNPVKILPADGLEKMVAAMERDSSIGIVGPKLVHDDGSVRLSARSFPRLGDVFIKRTPLQAVFKDRMKKYLQLDANHDDQRDVDWLVGGCLLIRHDLLTQLGGFDDRFFLFFEDIDLCRRCWLAGKRVVYFPRVAGTDRKRRFSEMSGFAMPFRNVGRAHISSAVKYFWKWRGQALPKT